MQRYVRDVTVFEKVSKGLQELRIFWRDLVMASAIGTVICDFLGQTDRIKRKQHGRSWGKPARESLNGKYPPRLARVREEDCSVCSNVD